MSKQTWTIQLDPNGVKLDTPAPVNWNPYDPTQKTLPAGQTRRIQAGDTISVNCDFNLYKGESAGTYWDLHLAAVASGDVATVNTYGWWEQSRQSDILVNISTKNPLGKDRNSTQMNVINYPSSSTLNYGSNATYGVDKDFLGYPIINSWSFTASGNQDWVLVFAFGDPHVEDTGSIEDNPS